MKNLSNQPFKAQGKQGGEKVKAHYWKSRQELLKPRKGDAQIWGPAYKTVYYEVTKEEFENNPEFMTKNKGEKNG